MKTASAVSLFFVSAAMVSGCASQNNDVSDSSIIHNLSPELRTSSETSSDAHANVNVVSDLDSRMFFGDLGRALYTDQPSRLTPYPMYGVSGIPR